ncbi:MAG: lysophospholipase [Muribaculaceae bacterium]|nr:lysophospholipase [Muribaculaceae bacterium]
MSLAFVCVSSLFAASPVDGDWSGKLNVGGHSLKLVLHVGEEITLDSPDQGAFGIPCETLYKDTDSISLSVPSLFLKYGGKVTGDEMRGIFRQGLLPIPLTLTRGVTPRVRPQTPQPPFPYTEEEITVVNEAGGSELSGTLTLPENAAPGVPLVILVSGSGLQNRDEELFEHRPFAVIADHLARHGIASFRYDDRGFGASKGEVETATTEDFASDAGVVLERMRRDGRFGKIGIVGHSEGGLIAYMLASGATPPDFIVSIAGPTVAGRDILLWQNKLALINSGVEPYLAEQMASKALESPKANEWLLWFMSHDPADDLKGIKCPALLVFGEKDMQVPPALNEVPARACAPGADVRVYPGLNHLMQNAGTGMVAEYAEIEETISPRFLDDLTTFIYTLK